MMIPPGMNPVILPGTSQETLLGMSLETLPGMSLETLPGMSLETLPGVNLKTHIKKYGILEFGVRLPRPIGSRCCRAGNWAVASEIRYENMSILKPAR